MASKDFVRWNADPPEDSFPGTRIEIIDGTAVAA